MDLSIIVISYNTKELLDQCLGSVFAGLKPTKISFEVIVIDNASADGSVDMVKKKYPKVVLQVNKENAGFGKANNDGIKHCRGERVFLLNSDTIVVGDAISKLYEFSLRHKKVFVAPKLLNPDRSKQSSAGPFFTLPVVFAMLFLRGDRWGLTRWSPDKMQKVDWVSGAAIMAPKQAFFDDCLFDEKIFMYMEEIDLLYRAGRKGYATFFIPTARIIHIGSGSSKNKKKAPILQIYRGLLYFYQKHYSKRSLMILKFMLRLKAFLAMMVGVGLRNKDLKETYEEAYRLV